MASPARATISQSQVVSEGRNIFGQACIQCHGIGHIMIKGKTEEGWRDTVYSMISRGAQMMPDEIDPLIAYLAATYRPDSAAPAAEGATLPDEAGRVILDRTCTALSCAGAGDEFAQIQNGMAGDHQQDDQLRC